MILVIGILTAFIFYFGRWTQRKDSELDKRFNSLDHSEIIKAKKDLKIAWKNFRRALKKESKRL